FLTKWLMVVFVLNMFYSFTEPWGEKLWAWSPQSGVFLSVPLLGNYNGRGDLLLEGALFCICVGSYVITRQRWRWLIVVLAMGQFLGLAISQVRRMYVGAVVILVILLLLGEAKKFAKLFVLLPAAVIVILLVTTVGGIEISGRIGEVNLDFFKAHIRSIHDSEGTPGSAVESRFLMADEAIQHFREHPVLGVGFGQPLLTVIDQNNGAVTRMPHNSSLSYLARLGIIGFAAWIAFHFFLIKRFINALRQRKSCDNQQVSSLVLWFFLFYVLFMIGSLVEAPFEFPSSAVPFYFFMGFALGLIQQYLSGKDKVKVGHRLAGS
ncbi:MAG: O-antigen ligase family protein, partial [Candidatus Sulfotelmatobacter sp.]